MEPPATGYSDQFDTPPQPFELQLSEQLLDGIGTEFVMEEDAPLPHREGLVRANQRGIKDAPGIHSVHKQTVTGLAPMGASI